MRFSVETFNPSRNNVATYNLFLPTNFSKSISHLTAPPKEAWRLSEALYGFEQQAFLIISMNEINYHWVPDNV